MESEDITKLVDGVYKNILEKFNPGARQLITAGKGYLKSLHGAAAAARSFNETLSKIALNAQHSGTNDIGVALLNVVSVYKEIQEQQMNILKAFYVDLLVPLETNLEKDTKVVQHEQKKFMQQHKVRLDSYQKAVATMKKQQRKKKTSPENTEKELRLLEEQKKKLDLFCEQSYRNAMQQERRRYGFVLERQCSIAKHWMAYHTTGKSILVNNIENWQDVANSREFLPPLLHNNNSNNNNNNINNNDNNSATLTQQIVNKRLERFKDIDDLQQQQQQQQQHNLTNNNSKQLKKSRSIDATYGDMRSMHELNAFNHNHQSQNSLPRAKSDFNLNNTIALQQSATLYDNDDPENGHWDQRYVVKALYTYMPSGENQLMLEEGDRIALVGGKAKGWQFGENLRTQMFGWFPISYTNSEFIHDNKSIKSEREHNGERSRNHSYDQMQYEHEHNAIPMRPTYPEQIYHNNREMQQRNHNHNHNHNNNQQNQNRNYHQDTDNGMESDTTYRRDRTEETSPTRMFGDTYRQHKKYRPLTNEHVNPRPGPPPTLPAPVPSMQNTNRTLNSSQSFCAANGASSAIERRKQKLQNSGGQAYNQHTSMNQTRGTVTNGPPTTAKTSLHSSNDSGFANEPPPQPEVDYSDEEHPGNRVPIRRRNETDARNAANTRELSINSWSLNRNFRKSVESRTPENDKNLQTIIRGTKSYDLIASDDELLQGNAAGLKRTKSFWKFGGVRAGDNDILAGMSMWQHRDLVATPNVEENRDEGYRTTSSKMESEREVDNNNDTLTKSNSLHFVRTNQEKSLSLRKDSITSLEMYDEDENIYGIGPMISESPPQITQIKNSTGFTPKSRMKIMKTIEIDIENPADNTEKLNTIKGGHKGYRESTMIQHHHHHHHPQQQQLQQQHPQKHQQSYYNQGFNNRNAGVMESKVHATNPTNTRGGNSSSHYKKSYESKNQQQTNKHNPINTSRALKTEEASASTESEANESELDNGTLKMSDVNNFFDTNANGGGGGVGIIMKTVKRKDILKQYYSSEDESEEHDIKSTSSDPYDCIVINDHLVRGGDKQKGRNTMQMQEHQMEFQTFRASATTTSSTTTTHNAHSNAKHNQKHHNNNTNNHNNHNTESNINDTSLMEKNRSSNRKSNYPNVIEQERYMHNNNNSNATRHSNNAITMNTPTATILPRTRLMKSSASMTLERSSTINSGQKARSKLMSSSNSTMGDKHQHQQQQQQQQHYNKTYGPWYDFWDQQDDIMEHTSSRQRHQKNPNNNN